MTNSTPAAVFALATPLPAGGFNLGQGKRMSNDTHFLYKVTNEEADGRFALLQGGLAPRMLIPPHVHEREDEMTIVIRGTLGARVDDEEYELGPGGVLLKPRGILHAMWNPTDEPQVLLEYITPGAYVAFFEEVAALGGFGARHVDLDAIAAKYGQRWIRDAEWLPDVVRRYSLHT
jgi:quercetin dioxygenase-like cupin family protein